MKRVATPEIKEGPENFWPAVRYFYNKQNPPTVGLVVVKGLLGEDDVAVVADAANKPSSFQKVGLPNAMATKPVLEMSFITRSILMHTLDAMNQLEWDPNAGIGMKANDDFVLTKFGKSINPHSDLFAYGRTGQRPVGVALSISIGKSRFAAALPPENMRNAQAATFDDYLKWHSSSLATTEVLHSAELESGDAAIWLQPGVHEAQTEDPTRFACMYISDAVQKV